MLNHILQFVERFVWRTQWHIFDYWIWNCLTILDFCLSFLGLFLLLLLCYPSLSLSNCTVQYYNNDWENFMDIIMSITVCNSIFFPVLSDFRVQENKVLVYFMSIYTDLMMSLYTKSWDQVVLVFYFFFPFLKYLLSFIFPCTF